MVTRERFRGWMKHVLQGLGLAAQRDQVRPSPFLVGFLDQLKVDLRYGLRILRQSPVFTAVALLSLTLAIGANTAIFELAENVLLKSLPIRHSEELRLLSWTSGPHSMIHDVWGNYSANLSGGHGSTSFSFPVFEELRKHNRVFQSLVGFKDLYGLTAIVDGAAEPVNAQLVTGDFYAALGVQTEVGRTIEPSDDEPSSAPVAVISDAYWKKRFGQSFYVLGKKFVLNGTPLTIIGVNPPQFGGTVQGSSPEVFLPVILQPRIYPLDSTPTNHGSLLANKDEFWFLIMGRLKPGVTDRTAQAALDGVFAGALRNTLPQNAKEDRPAIRLLTGSRGMDQLREHFSKPTYVLLAVSGLVLLLACVNLANLLLARAAARGREIGIRAALGARRSRIIRQVMTESLLLAFLGGIGGMLLGYWARNLIPGWTHGAWQRSAVKGEFDGRVFAFSIVLCLLTGLLFGLAPAWHAMRGDFNAGLKETTRTTPNRSHSLAGKLLVGFQVALSVLLVIGAGLFVRTLLNLKSSFVGFEPRNVLLFSLTLPESRYQSVQQIAFFHQVEERLAALPGVKSIAVSSLTLLSNSTSTTDFTPDGIANQKAVHQEASFNSVSAGFFGTMGIRILAGRAFDSHDTAASRPVAVVSERLAKQFFPNLNPVGRTFTRRKQQVEIVGVCADIKSADLKSEPVATYYRPYLQSDGASAMTFEVKTTLATGPMTKAIRDALRLVDRDIPLTDVRTQTEQIDSILLQEKLFATLTTGFGALALLLASIGIYGVMAYTVARRTNEIGIRMALGAQKLQILSSVLRETAWLALAGVTVGVGAAFLLTRLLKSMLYGIKPGDPATVVAVVLVMFAVSLSAGFFPARGAANVDPMSALRHD